MHTQPAAAVRGNIWKLTALRASSDAFFAIGIIVPFFLANDVSIAQVFYLQAIFTAAIVLCEVPSGYLSDRWGRKNTIVCGSVFGVVGMLVYALATGFWEFFLAEVLLAVSISFHSGTVEAMTYDTLLALGRQKEYRKIIGRQFSWSLLVQATASVAGGLLAAVSLRTPVSLTVGSFAVALGIAFLLREPHRHKLQSQQHVREILRIAKATLVESAPLRSVIGVFSILASLTLCLVWFSQPYQTAVGLPLALFGLAHAVMMVGGAAASALTHSAERLVDDRWFLIVIASVVVASYIALGFVFSLWGIALLAIGRSAYGAFNALCGDLVNRMTTSDIRATVISLQNFSFRVVFTLLSPILGYLIGVLSLAQAMLWTGIGSGALLFVVFVLMRRVWKEIPA
ncbi:MAG: major facilitator superfamily permease [Candidatus Peregrinibacteria bacterium Gr01-1014_25]|nr:MAG: major facilitator superfamily permease [Candidatus Peregrinibacteria bacterium Gr01-1014_25]